MKIPVSGSKSKLQSSLDFYLKITSISDYKSLDDMRKKMFTEFIREENARLDLDEFYNSENEIVNSDFENSSTVDLEEVSVDSENECVDLESESINLETKKSSDFLSKISSISKKNNLEVESVKSDIENLNNSDLETVETSNSSELEIENVNLDIKNTMVKEVVANSSYDLETESVVLDTKTDMDYVSNGRFVEDFVVVESDGLEECKDLREVKEEELEYVPVGRFVEDFTKDVCEETEKGLSENDFIVDGNNMVEEDSEDFIVDENSDDMLVEDSDEFIVEDGEVLDEDSEEDLLEEEDLEIGFSDDLEVLDAEEPTKSVSKSQETKEDILVKPANIRDFIRQSGRCVEESLALKYYTKKEIGDALRRTKIYKRNGKLYI